MEFFIPDISRRTAGLSQSDLWSHSSVDGVQSVHVTKFQRQGWIQGGPGRKQARTRRVDRRLDNDPNYPTTEGEEMDGRRPCSCKRPVPQPV